MVSRQWDAHVPSALAPIAGSIPPGQFAKARFIAEMYARACYSTLLVSADGPALLRLPVHATATLPLSRGAAIRLGRLLLTGLDWLLPEAIHRQLLLTSMLMGIMDIVLDETASSGEEAAVRLASLMTRNPPPTLRPHEELIANLVPLIRRSEGAWQSEYWENILQIAVRDYCLAEVLAVSHAPDPMEMGHRWAGIQAVIKGMWYVVGPCIGLRGSLSQFEQRAWNREQRWMADTTMLMQMIDDWVDQDDDRGARLTPVIAGNWSAESVDELYRKTARELWVMMEHKGIKNRVVQQLFVDLYNDYLHTALDAMRAGVAA